MQNGNQHKTTKPTNKRQVAFKTKPRLDDSKEKPCGTRTEHVHFLLFS